MFGRQDVDEIECPDCGGSGRKKRSGTVPCPRCTGAGALQKCRVCGGIVNETCINKVLDQTYCSQGVSPADRSPRDWPEDFMQENGNYAHECGACGQVFYGHKRRVTCKVCSAGTEMCDRASSEPFEPWGPGVTSMRSGEGERVIVQPFKHDCEKCIWVGWVKMDGRLGNMYFCPSTSGTRPSGSVVVRFSNRVDDYWSSPVGACQKGALSTTKEDLGRVRGDEIWKTANHNARAFARCSHCGRYSDHPKALHQPGYPCDCGKSGGWSGSFERPTLNSDWSEKEPG